MRHVTPFGIYFDLIFLEIEDAKRSFSNLTYLQTVLSSITLPEVIYNATVGKKGKEEALTFIERCGW